MKKVINNEVFRGVLVALLGVDIFLVICGGSSRFDWWGLYFTLPPVINLGLIVAGIGVFALIMRSSGHYGGLEEIKPNFFDKIPLEIYLFVMFSVRLTAFSLFDTLYYWKYGIEVVFLSLAILYLLFIVTAISLAARCKDHSLFSNSLTAMAVSLVRKFIAGVKENIISYARHKDIFLKLVLLAVAYGLADFVLMVICFPYSIEFYIIVKFLLFDAAVVMGIKYSMAYRKIQQGIEKIARGDTGYQVDMAGMPPSVAVQANMLNNINIAVSNAVSKQLKSEKLKTELITNVSHDIKTPLTSIINYIDLMQKEKITTQPLKEYTEVLQRQSQRLKKLIDDLVEASKASTGNITVHLASTGLCLRLNQSVGEFEDKARRQNLEIDLSLPRDEIYILSDGRLLWRIFDNLLSNACKYSMPGTRIYISAEKTGQKVVITFKNISRTRLNISPDELMERFVRGDSSRNTEGSGLGLSIAQSLTQILQGKMMLHIDGDMFKVTLVFDVI